MSSIRSEIEKILLKLSANKHMFPEVITAIEALIGERFIEVSGTGRTVRELPTLTAKQTYEKALHIFNKHAIPDTSVTSIITMDDVLFESALRHAFGIDKEGK